MENIILIVSIVLLVSAVRLHMLTQAHVITKIEKPWFDRLWTGSRPAKDNLTEEGLKYRKQSNMYAAAGLVALGIFVWLRSTANS